MNTARVEVHVAGQHGWLCGTRTSAGIEVVFIPGRGRPRRLGYLANPASWGAMVAEARVTGFDGTLISSTPAMRKAGRDAVRRLQEIVAEGGHRL